MPLIDRVQSGELDAGDAERCLDRLRAVVQRAHRLGLVHGSIGCGNIIATARAERVHLLDFGHAALMALEPDRLPAPESDIAGFDRLTAAIRAVASRSSSL